MSRLQLLMILFMSECRNVWIEEEEEKKKSREKNNRDYVEELVDRQLGYRITLV